MKKKAVNYYDRLTHTRFRYPADDQLLICFLFQPDIIVVCTVSISSDDWSLLGKTKK